MYCCYLLISEGTDSIVCKTSSLDAHAQNQNFDTVDKISKSPSGERVKSVIFITHRLSMARRADKIAMMEKGVMSPIS